MKSFNGDTPPPSDTGAAVESPSPSPNTEESTAEQPPQTLPRLVDLGADQCIPCKMMTPVLEELRSEYAGRLTVEFHDVWKDSSVGRRYGIRVIPTQIFYDASGEELFRHEGFMSKADILAKWKALGIILRSPSGSTPEKATRAESRGS